VFAPEQFWPCTPAAPYPDDPAAIRELLVRHWTSPVRFRETVEALYEHGARVFVEVGPRGNMTSFIEDILRGRPHCAVACDQRRRSGVTQLNHVLGLLAVHDVDVDVDPLFEQRPAREIDWRAPPEAAGEDAASRVALSTSWPMLRLSPEAIERVRSRRAAPAASANGQAAPPQPAPEPSLPIPSGAVGPEPVVAEATLAGPLWTDAAPIADTGDEVAGAVGDHLRTMDRFLEASEQVMQAYLAGAAPVALEEARRPLVGTIVEWEPGKELLARRVFDPAEDRYLLDHTLGRQVSRTDPELRALALMPLAMSLEIVAEAAACLIPGRSVTGLRDVRAHRWLAFGEASQALELSARRLAPAGSSDRVRVELRDISEDDGSASPAVEATVLLDDRFPEPPAPLAAPLEGGRPSRWPPGDLYGEAMFHGAMWQAVRAVDVVAPAGAVARLDVLPFGDLLRSTPDPAFVLDPVVLDAAGQVIGFWAADRFERGRVVFPFRLGALDLYGPPAKAGEELTCAADIAQVGDALVRSNIDVLDAGGRCSMRLTGWEDKRFDVPDRFAPLTAPSDLRPLSTTWNAPLAAHEGSVVACRRLDARLPADGALWKGVWARRVLGRRERERFDALRLPEGRQLEWLGARTAAKDAVAELLLARHGLELLPADIEILADEDGCPHVAAAGLEDLGVEPIVSLAHSHGEAVALAALTAPGSDTVIGIDVERVRPTPAGLSAAALGPDERALLEQVPPELADEWLLRCWCAKEAAGKAVGVGVAPGADAPVITAVDPGREHLVVDVRGRRLSAHTGRDGDLIVATVLADASGGRAE
jgi:phosphopantetheinyl transferase/malonyl CoA-acyl carrier protein transacylase